MLAVVEPHVPDAQWSTVWRAFVTLRQALLQFELRDAFRRADLRLLMKPELQWELGQAEGLTLDEV